MRSGSFGLEPNASAVHVVAMTLRLLFSLALALAPLCSASFKEAWSVRLVTIPPDDPYADEWVDGFIALGDGRALVCTFEFPDRSVILVGESGQELFRYDPPSGRYPTLAAGAPGMLIFLETGGYSDTSAPKLFSINETLTGYELQEIATGGEMLDPRMLPPASRLTDARGFFVPMADGRLKRFESAGQPILSVRLAPGQSTALEWATVGGRSYRVQESTDLSTWVDRDTIAGDGSRRSIEVTGDAASPRFYRVVEE